MNIVRLVSIAACTLVLVACKAKVSPDTGAALPKVHVTSEAVTEHPMPKSIALTGTLAADQRTELSANAAGRVQRTFVERGQRVKAGDAVAQLDVRAAALSSQEAEASLSSVQTQLDSSQAECKRYQALFDKKAATQQEYDRQMTQCRQQESTLAQAKARAADAVRTVSDGTVRAPFGGVISERLVNVGDYVRADSKVATLVVTDPLRLDMTVAERLVPYVKQGQVVSFSAAGAPGRTYTGTVRYLGAEVRATTRDLVVEAAVPNVDGTLIPGMFVSVELRVGETPMLAVPKTAIVDAGNDKAVWGIVDGRITLRLVQLGVESGELVAIERGLAKGDPFVAHPDPAFTDGATVE
ncbi:MAG TPA: efflux RND transporter periplasmic adaptor subunit [Polyangiaceae bacterium]